jgi:hypothetical protein
MSLPPDTQRRLCAWLDDEMSIRAPDRLASDVLAATGRTPRRPAWRIPERWFPVPLTLRLAIVPRAVLYLVILTLLVALLGAGGLVVGSLHRAVVLPPLTGPARNGLIAYDSGGDIWVMNPDGTGQAQLTSSADVDIWPTWSTDGTHIAYWSWPSQALDDTSTRPLATQLDRLLASGDGSLVVMGADGSDPHLVLTGATLDAVNLYLSWSPDSRHLVASRLVGGSHTVTLLSADGTPPVDLVPGETPAWSPDGSLIAYRSSSAPSGVWVIRPDGKEARRVTTASGSGGAFYLSQWAPDGSAIVFYAGHDGAHDVWTVATNGDDEGPISTDFHDEYWPSWSPTGDWIVYSRVIQGLQNRPTFVLDDPKGSEERILEAIPQQMPGMLAVWSPDGTSLLGGDWQVGQAAFDLHVIRIPGVGDPEVTVIPIEDNVGQITWQRLAP